jgi:transcriptional regulator with XRE-family HTH domain
MRKLKGLTQEEVSERMGVNTSWVGRIERGRTTPGLKLLGKIARALAVKVIARALAVKVKDLIPY